MKKIALVLPNNIYLAPYVRKYISILTDCQLHLIYWDRFDMEEPLEGVNKLYRHIDKMSHINAEVSQLEKLKKYYKFSRYVKKVCKKERYDYIVIFQPMMALMYAITKFFTGMRNVIVDVRDFTYEHSSIFRRVEANLFKRSKFVVISSPFYKDFLPENAKYIVMENMNPVSSDVIREARNINKKESKKIKIGYIGLVRFVEQNLKIIDKFANDERFELLYIGKGSEVFEEYIEKNNISNIVLISQFDPSETEKHFASVDLIQNIYGTGRDKLKYALSNKLYYAAMLGKPILVSPDTCMEKVTQQYEFGFSCDENDENLADKIYEYYTSVEWDEFYNKCDSFIYDVTENEKVMKSEFQALQK